MAPKRRSTVVAAVPLAAEIPFSPGNGHSVEEYTARKAQTTSWALNDLASSRDLAQWGNELRNRTKRWQQAFAAAMVLLTLTLAGLGYEVATHHAGPGLALGSSFRESFDSLSGSSQQALQQLATKSAKLLPEGTSIRDSYDKLSYSSQHALHHLVKSGIPLPSLLPDKQAGLEVSATDGSPMSDWTAQLSSANTETQHAQADARAAQHELQKAQQENQMLSDLLQRSQADLKLSQDHTHELLASVTQHTDANKALEQRYSAVRKELAEAVRIAKSCQQSDNGILPKCTNDSMGPLDWVLASLVGANVVLLLPLMKSFLKRTRTKAGAAAGPSTAASGKLPGKISPAKANAMSSASPRKAASAVPLSAKSTDADIAPVDETLLAVDGQYDTVFLLKQQRHKLGQQLEDSQKHFREVEANLKETKAKLKQSEQALADVTAGRPASEQKQAELAQQLQSAQQSNDQLTSSNTDLSQQLADAKSVKSHVQDNSQAVQQQLQAAKQQHVQMQEANTKLSQQLEQASSRKSAAMEELAKKKDEVADLSEELQVAHKRVEILEADYDRVNKHLQETQRQLAGARSDKVNVQETVNSQAVHIKQLTEDLASATSARDQLRARMEQKGNDLKKIKSGKENVEQTLQKYQADVTKLNKDLTDAQAGKTAVEADLKHKKSELKQRASEYEQLQSAKSELETSSAGKLKEVEQQLAASQQAKAKLDKALKQSAANVSQLKQELSDANASKSELEAEHQQLLRQFASAQKENKQLDTRNAELDTQLADAVATCDSNEQALQQAKAECSSLLQELTAANSGKSDVDGCLHKLSEQLKSAESEYWKVKTQCSNLTEELQAVKTDKDAAEDALNETQGSLQHLTQQLDTNQNAYQVLESHKAELDDRLSAVRFEKAKIEQELKQHKGELERLTDDMQTAQKTSRELWAVRSHLAQSQKDLADAHDELDRMQGQLEVSQSTNEQISSIIKSLDVQGLADVAEQIEAAGQRNAEIASLRHQKSMEVNALQLEKEEALASLAQQKQAELEAVTKIKDEELQLYKTRNQHLQEQLHAGVKRQETEEDGIRADQVERLLAERESQQLADAKQRIFELELRLNARQLQKAHSDSLAGTKDSPLARGWKLTGYNDLRSTVFGSYVNSQNSSAHQANSSPGARRSGLALGPAGPRLSSHPIESPEVSSHAIQDDGPVPSHALQSEPSNSPASSVGSVTGFPRPLIGSPAKASPMSPLSKPSSRPFHTPSGLSPFQAFSGAQDVRTPLSMASYRTDDSGVVSHAVQHSSSSSGSPDSAEQSKDA